ncbi:MAG TPA: hypothetical protein VKC54_01535 [Patescibacteria group bacterium]|nr:hypothetical protein [Patescibacteria group bacterium]
MDKLQKLDLFDVGKGIGADPEKTKTEWLSVEEYKRTKDAVIKKNAPVFENLIRNNPSKFSGFSDSQIKETSELMSLFVHGVTMVYKKFGEKYKNIDIELSDETGSLFTVRWEPGPNPDPTYLINPKAISYWKDLKKDNVVWGIDSGGVRSPKFKDIFELGGVEEAAHALFANEKKKLGKPAILSELPIMEYILSSDAEYRALLWKLSYVRKYKQEYVSDLEKMVEKVQKVRENNVKKI